MLHSICQQIWKFSSGHRTGQFPLKRSAFIPNLEKSNTKLCSKDCTIALISCTSMEKAMATHSSTLAWKIPWTEGPGMLQSMGSWRVGHDWATSLWLFISMHWRRKWQQTPTSQASTVLELWIFRCSSWIKKGRGTTYQTANIYWIIKKARKYQKNIYFCFIDYTKVFNCVDHNKLWKIHQEMGIPDHLTCLLRNMYAGQEATVRTEHATTDWFQIGKGVH